MAEIPKLTKILNTKFGETLQNVGCEEDLFEEKYYQARSINSNPVIGVKKWKKLILKLPDKLEKELRLHWSAYPGAFLPDEMAIIYSNLVMYDSEFKLEYGDWVRSTYIYELHDNCIIETNNTNFILVGSGVVQELDLDECALFFAPKHW